MQTQTELQPSAASRRLFSRMVARAEGEDRRSLSLARSIKLSVDMRKGGRDPEESQEIYELLEAGWIKHHPDGGWLLL